MYIFVLRYKHQLPSYYGSANCTEITPGTEVIIKISYVIGNDVTVTKMFIDLVHELETLFY